MVSGFLKLCLVIPLGPEPINVTDENSIRCGSGSGAGKINVATVISVPVLSDPWRVFERPAGSSPCPHP